MSILVLAALQFGVTPRFFTLSHSFRLSLAAGLFLLSHRFLPLPLFHPDSFIAFRLFLVFTGWIEAGIGGVYR